MLNSLHVVGLNHRTAPLSIREDLLRAIGPLPEAHERLRAVVSECVLLSTCNRLECYYRGESSTDPFSFLAPDATRRAGEHLNRLSGAEAIAHLVTVAASLDSLVLGESQILGQVRDAYERSKSGNAAGPLLHTVFQGALQAAKEVQSETGLGRGHLSVGSIAVDLCQKIWERLDGKRILLVGSGNMGTATLSALQAAGAGPLSITSRNREHAQNLSRGTTAVIPWDGWQDVLKEMDVCICAVDVTSPILERRHLGATRSRRHPTLLLIDLSVPRSIAEDLDSVSGIYRYDMDALGARQAAVAREREEEILAGREIVLRHVARLIARLDRQDLGAIYRQLDERGNRLINEELERLRGILPPEHHNLMREALKRYGNKLLHPVRSHAPGLIDDLAGLERLLLGERP